MNEDLVKRFAPILFLHPLETFVPVDPKRYLENANLWSSTNPRDDKSLWGDQVPGTAYPRNPVVAKGSLFGLAVEGGKLIDDKSVRPTGPEQEMFLELGGWKDAAGTHEAGVTATTTNVYADRKAIADAYAAEPLSKSRYWYYAEIFEGARLERLSDLAAPPDFGPYLTEHSALLCYYFFFPAHVQSVNADSCAGPDLVGATEAACHAGDWQCVAILLEGDGTGATAGYKPTYFGCTGAPYVTSPDQQFFRPYQYDADGYSVMKVERWRPATGPAMNLPEVDGEHPRLYVALGTHSLYTTPGTYTVYPFRGGESSQWCGKFDTPSVMPPGWGQDDDSLLEGAGAFLGKILGGAAAGGAVGGPIGAAAGGWAGLVSAGMEGHLPLPHGLDVIGTTDTPNPDQTPAPGTAITIRPFGVTVAGAGIAVQDWEVRENLFEDGRLYGYLVNRDLQRWWPNDDEELGYRGRWGQRATSDFLPRRAGPRFPDYLSMFLNALAIGDTRKQFDDL